MFQFLAIFLRECFGWALVEKKMQSATMFKENSSMGLGSDAVLMLGISLNMKCLCSFFGGGVCLWS